MASLLDGLPILVVEDEPLAALALALSLDNVGAQVITARSVQEAMTVVEGRTWSAAVLDYGLCDGDCSPLCEWMLERCIPFIVCTVHDDISASCRAGIHVLKPTNVEALVRMLERCINHDGSQTQ
jgi:DNA-binding response OmpR family regulator